MSHLIKALRCLQIQLISSVAVINKELKFPGGNGITYLPDMLFVQRLPQFMEL